MKPGEFDGLCEMCIVRSDFIGKNLKLEHLADLYSQKREALLKACHELTDLEFKMAKLHKEIVKTNMTNTPLLQQLDYMENQVVKEVQKCFKKIKAKFVKFNPFKEFREPIKTKLEEITQTIQELGEGTPESFELFESLCTYENKIVQEARELIRDTNASIEMNKLSNPLEDEDFRRLCREYVSFSDKVNKACFNFSDCLEISI